MGNSLLESGFNENMSFPYRKGWRMRRRITVWAFWLWITCGFVPTSVLLAQNFLAPKRFTFTEGTQQLT